MILQQIIDKRISLGKFQIKCFLILCLIDMNDGVELVLSSLLNPIIKAVFPNVSTSYISSLASIFYIGILFGSITSGILSDIYGRRKLIMSGAILQIVVSLLFYFANSLELMLILRFLYGYSFGYTVSVTSSMLVEITPHQYRGKGVLLINFCISLGKIYGIFLGYIFLQQNLAQTNWKMMMIFGSLPNIIVFIGSYFILHQSPRFSLTQQDYQKAFQTLDFMIVENNGENSQKLSLNEKMKLRSEFTTNSMTSSKINYFSFTSLISQEYRTIFLSLVSCWIIINFCYYGQLVIQALHITNSKTTGINLSKYFLTIFGQFPSLFLSLYLIDKPSFGRKKSLMYFFIFGGIFHLVFAFTQITLMGSVARFFMKNVFQIIYPLTTESFQTKIRTKGFGFCSGIGRIGSIIMPFILIPLDNKNREIPYILFTTVCILAAYITHRFIQQTLNKKLDESKAELLAIQLQEKNSF